MAITPHDWSVVIVGQWNPAILTPSGIARRLFQLDQSTPVEVAISLDAIAPPRVTHAKINVIAGKEHLIIHPTQSSYQELSRAMAIGVQAIKSLPETPLQAAGVNVRFTADPQLESLQAIMESATLDSYISDKGLEISGRTIARAINWGDHKINFSIEGTPAGAFEILFNFEVQSTEGFRHIDLLQTDLSKIRNQVNEFISECLDIDPEELET